MIVPNASKWMICINLITRVRWMNTNSCCGFEMSSVLFRAASALVHVSHVCPHHMPYPQISNLDVLQLASSQPLSNSSLSLAHRSNGFDLSSDGGFTRRRLFLEPNVRPTTDLARSPSVDVAKRRRCPGPLIRHSWSSNLRPPVFKKPWCLISRALLGAKSRQKAFCLMFVVPELVTQLVPFRGNHGESVGCAVCHGVGVQRPNSSETTRVRSLAFHAFHKALLDGHGHRLKQGRAVQAKGDGSQEPG